MDNLNPEMDNSNPAGAGDAGLTPNYLVLNLVLGNVTISTT